MKKIYIFIIPILIFIITLICIKLVLYEIKELPATINVGGYLGFNIDTDKLYFGTLKAGGTASRDFSVENFGCGKCLIVIKSSGPISKWLSLSENKFKMVKGEKKAIYVDVVIPGGTPEGTYNGTVKIYFWKTI